MRSTLPVRASKISKIAPASGVPAGKPLWILSSPDTFKICNCPAMGTFSQIISVMRPAINSTVRGTSSREYPGAGRVSLMVYRPGARIAEKSIRPLLSV